MHPLGPCLFSQPLRFYAMLAKPSKILIYVQICMLYFAVRPSAVYGSNSSTYNIQRGARWRSWLRHCATSRNVACSIPDGVTGFFHWRNPSSRTMALWLTQPLTEMSTRNVFWGKVGRCIGLTTLPPSCADCPEIWEPQPPGTLRACPGL